MKRLAELLIVILLLVVTACSTIKLVYPRLDWIIPYYVDDYITLNDQQQFKLNGELRSLLDWHCKNPIEQYSDWLARIRGDVEQNNISKQKIVSYITEFRKFWQDLSTQIAPKAVTILNEIDADQERQLFRQINERNTEYQRDYIDIPFADLRQKLQQRMQERLEKWLGELSKGQRDAVQRWSHGATKRTAGWVNSRLVWQAGLRGALSTRVDRKRFSEVLLLLIQQPDSLWTAEYRRERMISEREISKLLFFVYQELSAAQRKELLQQLDTWNKDISSLSCENNKNITKS